MSARVEKFTPARKVRIKQVVVGFDPEKLKAPFLLRCGALLIDYILLMILPVSGLLLARFIGNEGAKLLNSEINNVAWLITFLLALTNFLIFPMFSGQSVGKMLTGLRIANVDGSAPGFSSILVRHSLGYLLTFLTGGIGYLFSVFNDKGRALHDFVSGTVVVYGSKSLKRKTRRKTRKLK